VSLAAQPAWSDPWIAKYTLPPALIGGLATASTVGVDFDGGSATTFPFLSSWTFNLCGDFSSGCMAGRLDMYPLYDRRQETARPPLPDITATQIPLTHPQRLDWPCSSCRHCQRVSAASRRPRPGDRHDDGVGINHSHADIGMTSRSRQRCRR
jgi:hypothetical protein